MSNGYIFFEDTLKSQDDLTSKPVPVDHRLRDTLAHDVEKFLSSGKQITVCPPSGSRKVTCIKDAVKDGTWLNTQTAAKVMCVDTHSLIHGMTDGFLIGLKPPKHKYVNGSMMFLAEDVLRWKGEFSIAKLAID